MSLVVTPGDGNADSYADLVTAVAYAAAKGLTFPGDDTDASEQALRRATSWIDATYRARFMGQRRFWRAQSLEWPRYGVLDNSGYPVDYNSIPIEIVNATCEAAAREFGTPGVLAPDLERGGQIRRVQAGSVSVEWGGNASAQTTFAVIDGILSALLLTNSLYTSTAVR